MNNKALREIYREAFGDDGEFENRLFSLCGEYLRSVSCGEETAAMLFALPCKIIGCGEELDAYYLYAAATKKEYRGRGYMSRLIRELIKEEKPIFLKPQNDRLTGFYERLGFQRFNAVTRGETGKTALPLGGFAELSVDEAEAAEFSYTAMCVGSPVSLDNLCFAYIME
ncbi:MAG: GNAT family N-acetyltransferase [Acutalibacteraceae bacterium]